MTLINNKPQSQPFFNLFCLDEGPLTNFQWKRESDYCTVKQSSALKTETFDKSDIVCKS